MQIGLVGAPNSGKSTFFKAATLADVEIADYPFTTIKANQGVAYVTSPCPCQELGKPCNPQNSGCVNGIRLVPVKLLDVAGLVPGAHEGKGLGNQFLDDLRQASVLVHILDASGRTNEKGEKVSGYDPQKTVSFLEEELDLWYLNIFKREWASMAKQIEISQLDFEKQILERFSGLGIRREHIMSAVRDADVDPKKPTTWKNDDILRFVSSLRRSSKPIIIAANKMDLPEARENIKRIPGAVPCSAEAELTLRIAAEKGYIEYIPGSSDFKYLKEMDEKQKKALEFIKALLNEFGSTGVQKILNKAVFEILGHIVVYPVEDELHWTDKSGNVLPDALLVPKGTTARDLAFMIHTDIG
ncbi:MAG: redox-regulated ATPase YchF, partial [Candidatus Aenigmatarchaeota archaeon]